jgi:hypothetical protein
MTYTSLLRWVKLKRYCELIGDTPDAVQKKIARGLWAEGVHFKTGPDGVRYFNLPAIDQWVEQNQHGVQAPAMRRRESLSVGLVFTLQ